MSETPSDIPSVEALPQATPVFVRTEEDRKRWAASEGLARQMFGNDEEQVWQAARSIYFSDLPT